MKPITSDLAAAYALLVWARTPGYHGGRNPYCQQRVQDAERLVAVHESRAPEGWAGPSETRQAA